MSKDTGHGGNPWGTAVVRCKTSNLSHGGREQGLHLYVRCHISAPELLQFTEKCIWLDLMILRVLNDSVIK